MPPISISVNIDKIDKSRFFEGKKGRYLDLVLFETPESEYGDYMVKQQAKAGEKMPILGNGKFFKPKGQKGAKNEPDSSSEPAGTRSQRDPW
jgi:hypothetical protein